MCTACCSSRLVFVPDIQCVFWEVRTVCLTNLVHEMSRAAHSLSYSAEITTEWSCTSAPPIRLHALGRENFPFCVLPTQYLSEEPTVEAREPANKATILTLHFWNFSSYVSQCTMETVQQFNPKSTGCVQINYRSILQNLITDASSVTKLFIPPSDRRLGRTTTSKLPSERALNRHKFQDTPTTLGRWGSRFPPTLVYAFPARWQ
jgi:hypothetical protein